MTKGVPNRCKTPREQLEGKYTVNLSNGCWDINAISPYGSVQIRKSVGKYESMGYHKLSYIVHKGDVPQGMWVLHTCHNNRCCNPGHLYLGTKAQNEQDKVDNGSVKGDNHPKSKLTMEDIVDLRVLFGYGLSDIDLAKHYPVQKAAISKIRHGRTWGWM